MKYSVEAASQLYARTGDAMYAILIVLGFFGQFVLNKAMLSGNTAATAANIMSMEWFCALVLQLNSLPCRV